MNKFDIKATKYTIAMGVVFILFVLIVWNAFRYLPTENKIEDSDISINKEQIVKEQPITNKDLENKQEVNDEDFSEEDIDEPVTTLKEQKKILPEKKFEELEPIVEETSSTENSTSQYSAEIEKAQRLVKVKDYRIAIIKYQNALTIAQTDEEKFMCYEMISKLYAIQHRYGTALSFANRAYNIKQTTSLEILLAKLYYRTGNTTKAEQLTQNAMKREFDIE